MAALRSLLGWRRCRLPTEAAPRRPLWGLKAAGSGREGTPSGLSFAAAGAAGGALAWLACYHYYDRRPHQSSPALGLGSRRERGEAGAPSQSRGLQPIPVAAAAKEIVVTENRPDHEDLELYATSRERRFLTFASLKFEGQLFMTPYDFIQSVSSDEPRQTKQWKTLSKQDLNQILIETPPVWKGSSKLFRNLQERGIISYTEYLFLLCILTKPHAGFRIAFNMFDTDGNEMVDKKEFLVLQDIFRKKNEKKERKGDEEKCAMLVLKTAGDDLFPRSYWDTLRRSTSQALFSDLAERADDFTSLHSDTTLLIHFFGKKGKAELNFEDFYRFMDNLQTEVLEIEFLSYSNGMNTISEEDFAHILLRYTNVENTSSYLENVLQYARRTSKISNKSPRPLQNFHNHILFSISILLLINWKSKLFLTNSLSDRCA
uniref:Mitochondrial calcium uptake family member 3 n=1 Tax=Naja naja TaxID=35670 RepID=A0A8C6X7J7_NAJNA